MACATLEEMFALIRGTMETSAQAALQGHISSGCATCAENYRWLTELLAVTGQDDSFDFSEEAIAWSVAQFSAASASAPSRVQILARLVFDNLLPARVVEVRSMSAPAVSRQILYEAGNYDVDLRLEQFEAPRSILLLGQIASKLKKPDELGGLSVEMTRHASEAAPEDKKQTETDAR
jgi:hypothetical protein